MDRILRGVWIGLMVLGLCSGTVTLAESPFVRPNQKQAPVNAAPSEGRIRLDQLEFTGLFSIGDETTFSLYDKKNDVNLWLPEDGQEGGFSVAGFDHGKGELRVQFAGETRLISLNNNTITELKIASNRKLKSPKKVVQKDPETLRQEEEARLMVTDLLEIGMKEREKYRADRAKRLKEIRARQAAQAQARGRK